MKLAMFAILGCAIIVLGVGFPATLAQPSCCEGCQQQYSISARYYIYFESFIVCEYGVLVDFGCQSLNDMVGLQIHTMDAESFANFQEGHTYAEFQAGSTQTSEQCFTCSDLGPSQKLFVICENDFYASAEINFKINLS